MNECTPATAETSWLFCYEHAKVMNKTSKFISVVVALFTLYIELGLVCDRKHE